jgi:hypothetical protein
MPNMDFVKTVYPEKNDAINETRREVVKPSDT